MTRMIILGVIETGCRITPTQKNQKSFNYHCDLSWGEKNDPHFFVFNGTMQTNESKDIAVRVFRW